VRYAASSGSNFGVPVDLIFAQRHHAAMGQAQGAMGFGPVADAADLPEVLADAVAAVRAGAVAVVDVRVLPGYGPAMAAATGGSH